MLRVPSYVAPSPISGVGLFSPIEISAGEIIWEYKEEVDWRMTDSELESFPEPFRSRLGHYVYREESGLLVLCGDNAKYMNHSDRPNCDDTGSEFTVAARVIRPGEELTCDYRVFDVDAKKSGIGVAGNREDPRLAFRGG